jgi:hypothetical protein
MKLITQNRFSKVKCMALLVFTFMMSFVQASNYHHQTSALTLQLSNQFEHKIVLDNITYTGVFNNFRVDNLNGGNHRIKVVQLVFSRQGRLINKIIIYNGMVYIPGNSKVWARIMPNGRIIIERTLTKVHRNQGNRNRNYERNGNNQYNQRENSDNNYSHRDDDYSYQDDDHSYQEENYQDYSNDQKRNNRESGEYHRNGNSNPTYNSNEKTTFELTIMAVQKQSFDTDRLKVAKNSIAGGDMLSREILEITKLFSFEATKLEFAKFAYGYTSDKKNYLMVQEAFQFSSSSSELQDYILQR